jgi:hypothetical protein
MRVRVRAAEGTASRDERRRRVTAVRRLWRPRHRTARFTKPETSPQRKEFTPARSEARRPLGGARPNRPPEPTPETVARRGGATSCVPLLEAGDATARSQRRVLVLRNPGARGRSGVRRVSTRVATDSARRDRPCHRMPRRRPGSSSRAWRRTPLTAADDDEPGDFILRIVDLPRSRQPGDTPVIWLDGGRADRRTCSTRLRRTIRDVSGRSDGTRFCLGRQLPVD